MEHVKNGKYPADINEPLDKFEDIKKIDCFHFWVQHKDGTIYDPCFTESNYTKLMSKSGKLIYKPIYKDQIKTK